MALVIDFLEGFAICCVAGYLPTSRIHRLLSCCAICTPMALTGTGATVDHADPGGR